MTAPYTPPGYSAQDAPFLFNAATIPKLFLSGDQDAFAPAPQLAQVAESAAHPRRLLLLPGADHFFTGHLQAMQAALADWCQELVL